MKVRLTSRALGALLLGFGLALGACSSPERVRVASGPLPPPLPPMKPADPGAMSYSAPGAITTETLGPPGSAPAAAPATSSPAATFPAAATPTTLEPSAREYQVQAGDTLFSISQRLDVPLAAIIADNGLAPPFDLRVGQRITVPSVRVHEVRRGETLHDVAQLHGLDSGELARSNRLEPPFSLWTGQRLVLPGGAGEAPAQEVEVTLAEATAATEPAGGQDEVTVAPMSAEGEAAATASVPAGETATDQPAPEEPGPASQEAGEPDARPQPVAIPAPPPRSGGRFLWPLEGETLQRFGPQGDGRHNDGINIAAERGTEVRAAENGVVAYAGNELRGFGNLLLIKHADDWVTAYAHNDELMVSAGQSVTRGQPIARVGSTGSVGRPQLHFEIRKGTRAIDPLPLLGG